jgi:predicted glycoside hydrolase/deacetylase ChbG (UPF0249 family)
LTRLVLNADDLGLAPAQTRRVLALLVAGGSGLAAVEGLHAAGIRDVGVHLCVTGGERPVAPPAAVPSLLEGGTFRPDWVRVLAALASWRIRLAEVEREWEAQTARVEEAGFAITHLDSHQHLHLHPRLFPITVRIAKRFRVPFVRAPRGDDPAARADALRSGRVQSRLLAFLGARARKLLAAAGLPEPPRVLGLAEAGRMTRERLERILAALPQGDYEAVLHAGEEDDVTRARYDWGYSWREESEALESETVGAALAARGITLVSFGQLQERSTR